ncbi:hypothetical protein FM037_14370 [Shewanella psychropiezotolerans]|uniref:Holin n=1 Tax=Shewanella psychropiezotolerans TaxID=2593655 RepID=A0ABX5X185_9GAMM|nr:MULTISPECIES: hypothetical protein [Shewanella]MPY23934.1 hypothetical protein [Shewanella sp. YLB-07]QDO84202.1 hypothetical protein FM037_14370 [Shewanella psychropiezotolerans]
MQYERDQLENRLKENENKLKRLSWYDFPAMLVIGLGLFSKFGDNPESLHPLLADSSVVNTALAIAVPWAAFCTFQTIKLALENNKIKKELGI